MTTQESPELEVLDGRYIALLVTVDHQGIANVRANGVDHKQAAAWMRHLANSWDPRPAEPEPAPLDTGVS